MTLQLFRNFVRQKVHLKPVIERKTNQAIIFIHGLLGDSYHSWKRKGAKFSFPEMVKNDPTLKRFSVFSFGYRSSLHFSQYDFREIASLLHSEIEARLPSSELFFITHSMGGLVVQQYIVDQIEKGHDSIFQRVKGIAYLSVPFDGSVYGNLFSHLHKQVSTLKVFSKEISDLKKCWLRCFSSMEPFPQLLLYGAKDHVVSRYSAKPTHMNGKVFDVDEDHKSICKIDRESTVYLHIKNFLMRNSPYACSNELREDCQGWTI